MRNTTNAIYFLKSLSLLKNGADEGLFLEDSNKETPVSFIATSNLKAHLDTKQRNQGPVGHTDQVAHCDISILQPKVPKDQKKSHNCVWNFITT